jgi:hypothetical protein
MDAWLKVVVALVPLLLAGLTAVAWSNSHSMVVLTREYDDIRAELVHQRGLVEQRLVDCK